MAHKIIVDKEKCIGCGACASTCSNSFGMKEGKAFAVKSEVEGLTCEKDA
ncbi:MAG: ferredoxin, partial [Nanoarchaeota archaeon]|nr:ferredoxin [Nanoarchaeota archaeon]